MSRSIRGRHHRRKHYSTHPHYRHITLAIFRLARIPKPLYADRDARWEWEKAHHQVFRGGGWGHHSDYHQCVVRKIDRKRRRAQEKQEFSLDRVEGCYKVGSKSMESPLAEFLVIEVENGKDGLAHLCEAESWEAAVEDAKDEGCLDGPFRQGDTTVTEGMVRLCVNEIKSLLGVIVPDQSMRDIIGSDRELRQQLTAHYRETPGDSLGGLDTFERDLLCEAFATFLGSNEGWPLNMASEEESEFFLDLVRIAVKDNKIQAMPEEAND